MTTKDLKAESDAEDASLVSAQEAFLSSGSHSAAKVIRTTDKPENPPSADEYVRHGPEWYQQMKGVRFRLDDLEDDDVPPKYEFGTARKPMDPPLGSAMMGDIVERKTSNAPPVFSATTQKNPMKGFPAPRRLVRQTPKQKAPIEASSSGGNQLEGKALMEEIDRSLDVLLSGV